MGLKTEPGRLITLRGIKPISIIQWMHRKFLFIWFGRTTNWILLIAIAYTSAVLAGRKSHQMGLEKYVGA
ncbi:hypothetical protein [Nostoc sp. MG11]|uniref:hypothetical protein n=1 Tax=Nostoc sp. MG11 TaxID=2721166 RepID=UPI0018670936